MKINPNILKKGDVLLAHNSKRQHTAMYVGDGMMVHASIGEKGTTGNRAGDQTKKEITIAKMSGEWDFVLRYPDSRKATAACLLACDIANDDSHGYDQVNRWGTPDFDCSTLMICCYEKQGLPIKKNGGTYTGNMREAFKRCGFAEVSDMIKCTVDLAEVYPNDKGEHVRAMQALLNLRGYYCGQVDGDYGKRTRSALDRYQTDKKLLPVDGICGRGTWTSLIMNK